MIAHMTEETHPWTLYAPEGCRTLVVGSFPTDERNRAFDFFYPNKANRFWGIMAAIANVKLQHFEGEKAVEERKAIAQRLGIALTDMAYRVSRVGRSSLDENLTATEYIDIFAILDKYPSIDTILFTGGGATAWFDDYLARRGIVHRFPRGRKPVTSSLTLAGGTIRLVQMRSTSPHSAAGIPFDQLKKMYEIVINDQ